MPEDLNLNEFYDVIAPNTTGTPERNLLMAIIERAILDLTGNDPEEVRSAEEWLFGDEVNEDGINFKYQESKAAPFSFAWICGQLDLNIASVAAKIKRMPRRGNSRVAPWYMQNQDAIVAVS